MAANKQTMQVNDSQLHKVTIKQGKNKQGDVIWNGYKYERKWSKGVMFEKGAWKRENRKTCKMAKGSIINKHINIRWDAPRK